MDNIWEVLKPEEKLIASKGTSATLSILPFSNTSSEPLFSLYLVIKPNGNYILIIFMRIKIIYQNGPGLGWSFFEKNNFSDNITKEIRKKWGGTTPIKLLKQNKKIHLDFRFVFTESDSPLSTNHWTITVEKIKKGDWKQSYLTPALRTGKFDSNDLVPVQKAKGVFQRGMVHEFGHMLGLGDEYLANSPYVKDINSIMNAGETIRTRHRSIYMNWLDKVLFDKKIS